MFQKFMFREYIKKIFFIKQSRISIFRQYTKILDFFIKWAKLSTLREYKKILEIAISWQNYKMILNQILIDLFLDYYKKFLDFVLFSGLEQTKSVHFPLLEAAFQWLFKNLSEQFFYKTAMNSFLCNAAGQNFFYAPSNIEQLGRNCNLIYRFAQ